MCKKIIQTETKSALSTAPTLKLFSSFNRKEYLKRMVANIKKSLDSFELTPEDFQFPENNTIQAEFHPSTVTSEQDQEDYDLK